MNMATGLEARPYEPIDSTHLLDFQPSRVIWLRQVSYNKLLGTRVGEAQNPGPLANQDDYALHDTWFQWAIHRLGVRKPSIDAFASEHNYRVNRFWTRHDDAFQQDWKKEEWIWANPPFRLLPKVWALLRKQQASCLLAVPVWEHLVSNPLLHQLCVHAALLPDQPIWLFRGATLLPRPNWRTLICVLAGKKLHQHVTTSVWLRSLTKDGDIESNPGPSQVTLAEFATDYLGRLPGSGGWHQVG